MLNTFCILSYLAILYRHTIDKNPGDVDECPDDECLLVRLELDLTNADPTDVDCFPRLYAKYPLNQLLPQVYHNVIALNNIIHW